MPEDLTVYNVNVVEFAEDGRAERILDPAFHPSGAANDTLVYDKTSTANGATFREFALVGGSGAIVQHQIPIGRRLYILSVMNGTADAVPASAQAFFASFREPGKKP